MTTRDAPCDGASLTLVLAAVFAIRRVSKTTAPGHTHHACTLRSFEDTDRSWPYQVICLQKPFTLSSQNKSC
ncbi:hypothetical protein M3J09_010501 [Ascochyta lentis]